MLKFKDIEISDKAVIDPYLQLDGSIMSDRCFASLYIWSVEYKVKWCIKNDFLYLCSFRNYGRLYYYMPLGNGDMCCAVNEIFSDARSRNTDFSVALITKERAAELKKQFGNRIELTPVPEEYDYVYNADELIKLGGKKYHSKRNFVHRFQNTYSFEFRDIEPSADKGAISDFIARWHLERSENNIDYSYECKAIERALDNYRELSIIGSMLLIDGEIVAFTLGAPQNKDVMDVMIEKALPDIAGAYQAVNNMFAVRHCSGYRYINREEDLGIEGLRKAKASYFPAFLTEKYVATFNSI